MSLFDVRRVGLGALARAAGRWRDEFQQDALSLGVFRILFAAYFLLGGGFSYAWIADLPAAWFAPHPLTITWLAGGFPSRIVLGLLDQAIVLSLAALLIGFRTRLTTFALLVFTIAGDSYRYSFGKIDHGILIQCVLLAMLWADWGIAFSYDARSSRAAAHERGTRSLRGLAVMLALGFLSAGLPKAVGWLDFNLGTSGFLSWLYPGYYTLDRTHLLAAWAMRVRPLWLWEFADVAVVVLELGVVVAALKQRWMFHWLALIALLHLGNCLLLNIPFGAHIICYLAFAPWSRVFRRLERLEPRAFPWLNAGTLLAVVLRLARGHSAWRADMSDVTRLRMVAGAWLISAGFWLWIATMSAAPHSAEASRN